MQNFKTKDAARRLTELGHPTSASFLQKLRCRGPDDPRDKGPDFWRDERGQCWYGEADLQRWVGAKVSARRLRGRAPQPEAFRRATQP